EERACERRHDPEAEAKSAESVHGVPLLGRHAVRGRAPMKWRAGERDQETSHARGARIRAARACRRQFFDSVGLGMTARAENALPAEAALAAAAAVTSARLLHRAAEGDPPRHRGHVLEPERHREAPLDVSAGRHARPRRAPPAPASLPADRRRAPSSRRCRSRPSPPRRRSAARCRARSPSVPNPKSVTKFGGVSTTLAALLLLGIAPTIPRRRALPASPNRPRLWQRTSDPGH